jgi:hypothetical protein
MGNLGNMTFGQDEICLTGQLADMTFGQQCIWQMEHLYD